MGLYSGAALDAQSISTHGLHEAQKREHWMSRGTFGVDVLWSIRNDWASDVTMDPRHVANKFLQEKCG
jgi:hypothetical protein